MKCNKHNVEKTEHVVEGCGCCVETETIYVCRKCDIEADKERRRIKSKSVMVTNGSNGNVISQFQFAPGRRPRIGDIVVINPVTGYAETVSRKTPAEYLSFFGKVVG